MKNIMVRQVYVIVAGIMLMACVYGNLWGSAWGMEKKVQDPENYVSHELLVKFYPWADENEKYQARQMVDAVLIKEIKPLRVEYWQLPEDTDTMGAVELVSGMPAVEYAEPNFLYGPQMVPDDTHFNRLWYLDNNGQQVNGKSGTSGADISAPAAWNMETGSSRIVIAVIDSGVAFDHPDLTNNIWRNAEEIPDNEKDDDHNGYVDDVHGWDFVNNDNNPSDYSKDLYGNGHGTHVAGIIAAEGDNGLGATGVMWQAKIMPIQIFDLFEASPFNATTFVVLEALMYSVDNGAKIINCSFGGPSFSQALYEAYQLAGQNGVLVVAAAGNDSQDNDGFPTYPAGYDLDNIISVAATDENDALASYSNYGKNSVDVAAPGGSGSVSNIFSTTPPPRELIFSDDFESADSQWVTGGEFESWASGYDKNFNSMVVFDSFNDYHENEFSYIRTAERIQAKNFRGLNLQFSISYALESRFDYLKIEHSEEENGEYFLIHSISGFSFGVERTIIWSNDADFDDFYLRFSLTSDKDNNYDGVYLDDISLSGINWEFTGDEYGFKSGTSMATPVVSGVAGLVWSASADLSCLEVKKIIMDSVDLSPDLAGKLISDGRVNAEAAVLAAVGAPAPDTDPDSGTDPEPETSDSGGSGGCFISVFSVF